MPKHRFWYCFHQATRPEELVAMFHAANDTIGIDKVRRNETTIAHYILNKFARNEYVDIKEANFYASQTYQKQHIYPSMKQYRNDQERKSILRLIAIVLYNISKGFLWERDQTIRSKENKSLKIRDRHVLYKLY